MIILKLKHLLSALKLPTRHVLAILLCTITFLMNSLKLIKVYIIRKGILQGWQWLCKFFTKNHLFSRKSQKTNFFAIFVWNRLEKNSKILKLLLKCFIDLKNPSRFWIFSFLQVFVKFLSYMPNEIRQKFHFFTKLSNFWPYSAWNFKNQRKRGKVRKCNLKMNVVSQ